jgi:hypothetical protein
LSRRIGRNAAHGRYLVLCSHKKRINGSKQNVLKVYYNILPLSISGFQFLRSVSHPFTLKEMTARSLKQIGTIILYVPLILLILLIACYPLKFFLADGKVGILNMKGDGLLNDWVWKTFFYMHITFGGVALLVGWTQFTKYLRERYRIIHRAIGKVYVLAVYASVAGVAYIGFYAEGGTVAFLGFMTGGFLWMYTTIHAYLNIKKGHVLKHQQFMIYSYAICLGAVTLRIWLPLLVAFTNNFVFSYQLVSWISWSPNLIVAWFIAKQVEYKTHIGNFSK